MLDSVRGRLLRRELDAVVVDCGPFAVRARVPPGSAPGPLGQETTLACHLLLRDEQFHLFGFVTPAERDLFRVLLTVSGLGPEKALALLGAMAPASIARAVLEKEAKRFQAVKGIGARLAQRLAIELEGKLDAWAVVGPARDGEASATSRPGGEASLLVATLVHLGYPRPVAEEAARAAERTAGEGAALETLVKAALRELQKAT